MQNVVLIVDSLSTFVFSDLVVGDRPVVVEFEQLVLELQKVTPEEARGTRFDSHLGGLKVESLDVDNGTFMGTTCLQRKVSGGKNQLSALKAAPNHISTT